VPADMRRVVASADISSAIQRYPMIAARLYSLCRLPHDRACYAANAFMRERRHEPLILIAIAPHRHTSER